MMPQMQRSGRSICPWRRLNVSRSVRFWANSPFRKSALSVIRSCTSAKCLDVPTIPARVVHIGCFGATGPAANFTSSSCRGVRPAIAPTRARRQLTLINYFRDLSFAGFRRRTPDPPPFSSMNSTPAASIAARNFWMVSARPPIVPSTDSSRATVGSETPERSAKSACDQARSALAALICLVVTKRIRLFV